MMVTIPAYFDSIIDKIIPETVPDRYIKGVRVFFKNGNDRVLSRDEFDYLFELAEREGEDIHEYILASQLAFVLDKPLIATDVINLRERLIHRFSE